MYKVRFREFNKSTGEMDLDYGGKVFSNYDEAESYYFQKIDLNEGRNSLAIRLFEDEETILEDLIDPEGF